MPRVFISYRHADSQAATVLLHDRLEKEFGKKQVFLDTSDIRPGKEFREEIQRFIGTTHVMLIVIGPRWLNTVRDGHRRLDDPHDLLRQEIEWGLEASIPIIPVLIDGVKMPRASDLPPSLRPLTRRTAFVFPHNVPVDQTVKRLVTLIWSSSGQRRSVVRRPRLLLFHSLLILTLVSVFLGLAVRAGLPLGDVPALKGLATLVSPPQASPRIVAFEPDSLTVVQGAPLTVHWTVEDANTCALYVDGVQHDLLPASASQATLTLDEAGAHELALVASRGELSTRETLQIQVDAPLQIRRFAAEPSVLTRYIASEVELRWDVAGATQVRLDGLSELIGQVQLSTFAPQGATRVNLRLEEQTVLMLEATAASGQVQRQPLLLRVEDPICIVTADQAPVYDGPGGAGALLEWRSLGEIVVPDRRSADGMWLRVHAPGGQHVWMSTPILHCRAFEPVDLPVVDQ
jgi:hypothetical protein